MNPIIGNTEQYTKAMLDISKDVINKSNLEQQFMQAMMVDDVRGQIYQNEAKAATKRAEGMKI